MMWFPYAILALQIAYGYGNPVTIEKPESTSTIGHIPKISTFWHYTDFHVDLRNEITNSSNLWGAYNRDTSPIVAFTGIEWGNDHGFAENEPDFVIWSGDAGAHSNNLTAADVIESLRFLSFHFKNAFKPSHISLVPLIGNHDVFPTNDMSPNPEDTQRIAWCSKLANCHKLWRPWIEANKKSISSDSKIPTWDFHKNCYQSALVNDGTLLILGLNSLVWYSNNKLVDVSIRDPLDQFAWMKKSLDHVRKLKIKAIIATHVPPGAPEFSPNSYHHLETVYNEQLVSILREYSDVIVTTIAAHEHAGGFRVILDEDHKPVGNILVGPAVSPVYLKDIGTSNPRFRQYQYDRQTLTIVDYIQYYLNLSEFGPGWDFQYKASSAYDIKSLTTPILADLLDEFTSTDDAAGKWNHFWKNQLGGRAHSATKYRENNGTCPRAQSVCRCEQICVMRHLDIPELDSCLAICKASSQPSLVTIADMQKGTTSKTGMIVGIVIGVLILVTIIIVIGMVIWRRRRA